MCFEKNYRVKNGFSFRKWMSNEGNIHEFPFGFLRMNRKWYDIYDEWNMNIDIDTYILEIENKVFKLYERRLWVSNEKDKEF